MFRNIVCFLVLAAMLALPLRVIAATSDEIRKEIAELEEQYDDNRERMEELEALLSQNAEDIQGLVAQKNAVDQQISLLYDQIENVNEQIRQYALLVAQQQETLDAAQARLEELNAAYIERIRAMEKAGNISYWSILITANSFVDFLDRVSMILEIARADQKKLDEMKAAAEEVETQKAALAEKKDQLVVAREVLLETERELEGKREAADEILRQLVAQGQAFEELLDDAEKLEQQLLEDIAAKENEFDEAKYQEWLATQKPVGGGSNHGGGNTGGNGNGGTVNTSGWMTPVPYYTLTSPFGMRNHPILGYPRMHNGVDLACAAGTPIYASKDGVVSIATYSDSAGNFVQLDHDGSYRSVYMHMTRYVVSPGQYVARGTVIGYVGNTGLSKGNHLHFGISLNGTYVNPMEYID